MKRRSSYKALPFSYGSNKKQKQEQVFLSRPSVKKTLERMILNKSESKYIDQVAQNAGLSNSGNTNAISLIAQGTAQNQRIGNHITPMYLYAKVCFEINPLATSTQNYTCKFDLILDRQPNGALAPFSTIFDSAVSDAALALRAMGTSGSRFKVLKTVTADLNVGGNQIVSREMYVDLTRLAPQDRTCEYQTSAANIAACVSNHYIFAFSCANGASTDQNTPVMAWTIRLCYKDS